MKKEKFWQECYTILTITTLLLLNSCVTDQRLNRPDVPICINQIRGCFCVDATGEYEIEDCSNFISSDPESYLIMERYVDDLEARLLKCLNYPKKCK